MQEAKTARERLLGKPLIGFDTQAKPPAAMAGSEQPVKPLAAMVGVSELSVEAPAAMVGESDEFVRGPRAMVGEGQVDPDF